MAFREAASMYGQSSLDGPYRPYLLAAMKCYLWKPKVENFFDAQFVFTWVQKSAHPTLFHFAMVRASSKPQMMAHHAKEASSSVGSRVPWVVPWPQAVSSDPAPIWTFQRKETSSRLSQSINWLIPWLFASRQIWKYYSRQEAEESNNVHRILEFLRQITQILRSFSCILVNNLGLDNITSIFFACRSTILILASIF